LSEWRKRRPDTPDPARCAGHPAPTRTQKPRHRRRGGAWAGRAVTRDDLRTRRPARGQGKQAVAEIGMTKVLNPTFIE
jgi:hypothetical protein